ncbi:NUDIX hydrolase [Ornithobacterium rhinotracheale]|uniref:NUDIX hydrolase n=1 Tax=Ornithobacterium rhinotracheale TaxID=28251 RepID=UPI001FF1B32F|nr:NUDIX domain-containing protein [Ornithobacterium rhinotracheale]MCK0200789.1 NUDIX domain-containing protein [Ornithobacterium rhinotracheale]
MTEKREFLDVSVDCTVFGYDDKQLKILLIEQKKQSPEHIPLRALPGDHVYKGEDIDDAANRVLEELTGLRGVFLKQFHAFGKPDRLQQKQDKEWLLNVRKDLNKHVVTIAYYSLIKMEDFVPEAVSFANKTEWVNIDEIPHLGFDHDEIFQKALATLRFDTENYNIAFELLPKKFTLSQLQNIYEVILDREFDKRNFRKSIKKLSNLIPLNEKQKGVFHKPAQLYSFDIKKQIEETDVI